MPRPCTICTRLDRSEIDRVISFQVVNLAEVARRYEVSRDALAAHRKNHLPAFLPAFQASADALTLGTLAAEAQRLYSITLDALGQAEAGVLARNKDGDVQHNPETGEPYREVSNVAVARFIKEARQGLAQLVSLAADAGSTDSRPAGVSNGELDARIGQALEGVMARALNAKSSDASTGGDESIATAELVEAEAPTLAPIDQPHANQMGREAGSHLGQAPPTLPPYTLPSRSDTPLETRPGITRLEGQLHELVAHPDPPGSPAGTGPNLQPNPNVSLESLEPLNTSVVDKSDMVAQYGELRPMQRDEARERELVVHPDWRGSPAASAEERAAAGFADIPKEMHDPEHDVVQRELAAYRERQAKAQQSQSQPG